MDTMNAAYTQQSSGTFVIRLSNGKYVRLNKNPLLDDRTVDSDGDGLSDLDELGFMYKVLVYDSSSQQYIYVDTWTYNTDPSVKDTDKDGYNDNIDTYDNTSVCFDMGKHTGKPANMISNGDNCFIDIHFIKYPYCVKDTKGEYVYDAEICLYNLGLIDRVDKVYGYNDIKAVAYLQYKYNIGKNGIIDNKTYWLLCTLNDIKKHRGDVDYCSTALYKLSLPQYQNPDYSQDYFTYYYNMMLETALIGVTSASTILSLFPGGDAADLTILMMDIDNYEDGDQSKIVADFAALGIDIAFNYVDEIVDAARLAKKAAAKTVTESITRIKNAFRNNIDNLINEIKWMTKREGYYEVVTPYGTVFKVLDNEVPTANITKADELAGALSSGKREADVSEIAANAVLKPTSLIDNLLQTDEARLWGIRVDGTNQGVEHFVGYWEKFPDRIPSLARRLGINESDLAKTIQGFKNFTAQAQRIKANGVLKDVGNGKKYYYLAMDAKDGVLVVEKDGFLQSMMPSNIKYFTKLID